MIKTSFGKDEAIDALIEGCLEQIEASKKEIADLPKTEEAARNNIAYNEEFLERLREHKQELEDLRNGRVPKEAV